MRYLREIKKFLEVLDLEPNEAVLVISQTLEGSAATRFDIAQQSIKTSEEFCNKFKARFWNADIQDE